MLGKGKNQILSVIRSGKVLINSITDPMFITDKNLIIRFINDQALNAMGYSRDEVIGKMTCADLCRTPVCRTANCTIKNCMQFKKPITAYTIAEKQEYRPSGKRIHLNAKHIEGVVETVDIVILAA